MNNKALWTLYIFKFFSSNAKIAILGFLTATTSTEWGSISYFAKLCIFLTVGAQVLVNVESLVDQTAARLAAGKPPIGTNGSGNTGHLTLEQAKQNEKNPVSVLTPPGT